VLAFTPDKNALLNALGQIQFSVGMGQLNFYDAVSTALDWIAPLSGKKALVLLTTGLDSSSAARWDALVQKLRARDVVIFPVALGGWLRRPPDKKKKATGPPEEIGDDRVAEAGADVPSRVASDVAAEKPRWHRRWRRRPRLATLAGSLAVIIIVASLAASADIVLQHRNASHQHQRAAEFAAAAREGVVTLTSLDFNDAKAGVQRIIGNSTGSFRDDFAKMAGDFTKVVEQSKVVERGTVQAVAVDLDSMTNDSAIVLIASTSEVTNAAGAKQDPRSFKLIVTLTRDGDQLKMSKVEFVS